MHTQVLSWANRARSRSCLENLPVILSAFPNLSSVTLSFSPLQDLVDAIQAEILPFDDFAGRPAFQSR
jgi:hypothetical protein